MERLGNATRTISAAQVIAALPPRLLTPNITFDPPLGSATTQRWHDTPTWMAPHAKLVALYDRPFWQAAGLSGDAQSRAGPMVDIHDASTNEGQAALFGFIGVDADRRSLAGEALLKRACVDQLARLFGEEALSPREVLLKDWARDRFTASAEDRIANGHFSPAPGAWVTAPWNDRLTLAGSETSSVDGGYLSGAVFAAGRAVEETLSKLAMAGSIEHQQENIE